MFGGLAVRAQRWLLVALAGAPAPADVDGLPVGHHAVLTLRPGQVLRLGRPPSGLRTYLAVRGGIDVPPVLGSRSTDVLSGIGPAAARRRGHAAGGHRPAGRSRSWTSRPWGCRPPAPSRCAPWPGRAPTGCATPATLARNTWTASSRSDRVGMRLEGGRLDRARPGEIPSEGMVRGAVQVPPGGEPVLFLADHPITGGYPVVAVVLDADVDRAAQVRPGQAVRFRLVPPLWKEQ